MRHYCENCSHSGVTKEDEDGNTVYACGLIGSWIKPKNKSGIMDHCTGWSWKHWSSLTSISACIVFALSIAVLTLLIICYVRMMMI